MCTNISLHDPVADKRYLLNSFSDNLLAYPSAILAGIDFDALRIWSTRSYFSLFGNLKIDLLIKTANSYDSWYTFRSLKLWITR